MSRIPLLVATTLLSLLSTSSVALASERFVGFGVAPEQQYRPNVALTASGAFVVVWEDYLRDEAGDVAAINIEGRVYGTDHRAQFTFQANSYTTGLRHSPQVVADVNGSFRVFWSGQGPGDEHGVFARTFAKDGQPTGGETLLHPASVGLESDVASAGLRNGGTAVAWIDTQGISGLTLSEDGSVGERFQVAAEEVESIAVTNGRGSEFVVAWSQRDYAYYDCCAGGEVAAVVGRRFAADSSVLGDFQVNSARDSYSYGFLLDGVRSLAASADASGRFVVGFDSAVPDYFYNVDAYAEGFPLGVRFERLSSGEVLDAPRSAGSSDGHRIDTATTPGGNFVVVWSEIYGEFEDEFVVYASAFDCEGAALAPVGEQHFVEFGWGDPTPAVAVNEAGDMVVALGIQLTDGVRLVSTRPMKLGDGGCALCGDADADGRITSSDALRALRTSVGLAACDLRRCDLDASQSIGATDALRILVAAVAGDTSLPHCSS